MKPSRRKKYSNMKLNIAVLPGDGIGPEVTKQSIKVLHAIAMEFNHTFYFSHAPVGAIAIDETGDPLPQETLDLCKNSDAILFGAIGDPKYDNDPSAPVRPEQGLLKLRKEMGLFANIRPVKAYDTLLEQSPLKVDRIQGTDISIYRELTGGIYFGEKKRNEEGTEASDLCLYTKEEIERIAHLAFKAAQSRKKKVTLVDKANVLESSRLWRKVVTDLAKSYPDVELDFLFVDNAAMQLIRAPKQFDVMVTGNMFGDILSDEAAMLTGSIGMLPSASLDEDGKGMYEPCHGSAPDIAGQDKANPLATILSVAMMLRYTFKQETAAQAIEQAVSDVLDDGLRTVDILDNSESGLTQVGCRQMGEAVLAKLL